MSTVACLCPVSLFLCGVLEPEGDRLSGGDWSCQLRFLPVLPEHGGREATAANANGLGPMSPACGSRCWGSCPALLSVRSHEKCL